MKIVWTKAAIHDLRQIAAYINDHNPSAALEVRDRIGTAIFKLSEHPHAGRPGRVADTRELIVPGTPYIVPYRVKDQRVEVLRIFHAVRKWPQDL